QRRLLDARRESIRARSRTSAMSGPPVGHTGVVATAIAHCDPGSDGCRVRCRPRKRPRALTRIAFPWCQEITMTVPQDIVERVRSEYLEMPGMRLTPRQLQRLCGIGPSVCDAVLESMVASRFLTVKPDGTYA